MRYSLESPLLWTRGVAARETLSYLDRRGIDAEPALLCAGLSRHQLSQDDVGVSAAAQYRFLELAATEANDSLLGLHVAAQILRGIQFFGRNYQAGAPESALPLRHATGTSRALTERRRWKPLAAASVI